MNVYSLKRLFNLLWNEDTGLCLGHEYIYIQSYIS